MASSPDPELVEEFQRRREEITEAVRGLVDEQLDLQPGGSLPDRITVAGSIYHQPAEGEPTQIPLKFERLLETKEQVFQRRLKVEEEWTPLVPERCWLKPENVGLVVVRNEEGRFNRLQPTREQRDEVTKKVIEIGYRITSDTCEEVLCNPGLILVSPGEVQPLTVDDPSKLHLRSRSGETRYTVWVFPR